MYTESCCIAELVPAKTARAFFIPYQDRILWPRHLQVRVLYLFPGLETMMITSITIASAMQIGNDWNDLPDSRAFRKIVL